MRLWQLPAVFLLAFAALGGTQARAQTSASPQQIQALIASGQETAALAALQPVLQAHPDSGVAWYLTAEAQDAAGNEAAASAALAKAEQLAPGLPFANADRVAALQAHLAQPAVSSRVGPSPAMLVIAGIAIVFLLFRMLSRRRTILPPGYQSGYGQPPGGPFPYSGTPYGPGPGIGGSLLTGLAAGAGFAAGERIIDGFASGRGDQPIDPGVDITPPPDRDDGLTGSPGWDDNTGGGDFDPNNNW